MARKPPKKTSPAVKAAADRAEARAKGKPLKAKKPKPIDPVIIVAEKLAEEAEKRGRPTTFKPEYVDLARKACMQGATDMELASLFDVNIATLYRWKVQHPEFCDAIVVGKEVADDRVERALYQRACGYELEVEKLFSFQGAIVRGTTIEHVQADKAAMELWLASRRSSKWRQVSRHEMTGKDGGAIQLEQVGDIAKARLVAFALGQALLRQTTMAAINGKTINGHANGHGK